MTATIVDLMSEIPKAVDSYWELRQAPILLSALGARLPPEVRAELRVTRQTLLQYIEGHLRERVRILNIPQKGDAAVPVSEAIGLSDEELRDKFKVAARSAPPATNPRFYPQVWAAFSRPWQEGCRRYISLVEGRPPRSLDEPAERVPLESWTEVKQEDLPDIPLGYGAAPGPVADAIRKWAERTGIDFERLYVPARDVQASGAERAVPQASLIELLGVLEAHELARINIPADIVLGLVRRLIK